MTDTADTDDAIWLEIGINPQHVVRESDEGLYKLICDKAWLQALESQRKLIQFPNWPQLDRRAHPSSVALEHPWTRILVQTYQKQPQLKVQPVVSAGSDTLERSHPALPLSYSQAVSHVASSNFRQLWEAAYKRYTGAHLKERGSPGLQSKVQLVSYDAALRQLIKRIYNCPVLKTGEEQYEETLEADLTGDCHANVLPALVAIETSCHYCILHYPPALECSLYDAISYSPALLGRGYNKTLFLIYQLLQLARHLQAQGLYLGDLRLQHIRLRENLWLQLLPRLQDNLLPAEPTAALDMSPLTCPDSPEQQPSSSTIDLKLAYDPAQFNLREYCELWCNGQLSNFDYLTILNNACGRSMSNAAHHHIMPWVTDFSGRNGAKWRDLTKSKYRLNKGDLHLDLMYQQASAEISSSPALQVPHHVSDFLSEITYFVYMARRTPQSILCAHVRPIWVPAEYPVSIQRLQEWTPDECIPEFYSDPMIFKSIHEDLPDLELPVWATCPEDFICKHREALESQYVSERLHHWIDLNFGYKLSGKAAIKSKNVCLSLVDQHCNLSQRGIVQLFNQAHPARRYASPWFNKTAPRLSQLYGNGSGNSSFSASSSSRRFAKSTENLAVNQNVESTSNSPRMSLRAPDESANSGSSFYNMTNFIELPEHYNPVLLLQQLETLESFYARSFPQQRAATNPEEKLNSSDLLFEHNSAEHSFTNQLFAFDAEVQVKSKNLLVSPRHSQQSLQQLLEDRRQRELQVLACLMVELFAMHRVRPLLTSNGLSASWECRLAACRTVARLHGQELPKPVKQVVRLLLQLEIRTDELSATKSLPGERALLGGKAMPKIQESGEEKKTTPRTQDPPSIAQGLPVPTTPAQLLEPMFANLLLPFPSHYLSIYALVRSLHSFQLNFELLELQTHMNCSGGNECARFTELDRQRVLFERKIAECKVMSCCAHVRRLLEPVTFAYEQFPPVELLLPHIIDLLRDERTSILTAWHLFDAVAQALGMAQTQQQLLQPVLKLYDVESSVQPEDSGSSSSSNGGHLRFSSSSSFKSRKSVKLYHHSFLLRLIVRFGLRCFLQHFIAPLIEAVGGYKEPEQGSGYHYHSAGSRRTSKNLSYAVEEPTVTAVQPESKPDIEELFTFEEDQENKSIDSFDMRASSTAIAEEARESDGSSPDKLAINELIYGTKLSPDKLSLLSQEQTPPPSAPPIGPRSPTIEIPATGIRRSFQLSAIDCDIGSRKSVDSFDLISQVTAGAAANDSTDSGGAQPETEGCDSLQASVISRISEAKALQNNRISEMSAESLVWLSHRLGPVLTARHITRNLLKLLSLCYVGQENLLPEFDASTGIGGAGDSSADDSNLNYFSIANARVVGDRSAARVLECLMSIAALYGENFLLLQYFPHISELIGLCSKRMTGSLEGAIISSLQLVKYMLPCLMDVSIMEHLQHILLESILLPILRLLSSTNLLMPSGYLGRSLLARKFVDACYALSVRLGAEMTREHLSQTLLAPFFLIFNKAYGLPNDFSCSLANLGQQQRALEELRDVFGPELAHTAYLAFLRFLGESIMQRTLGNLEFVLTLCHEHEQPVTADAQAAGSSQTTMINHDVTDAAAPCETAANSFGTQIVGNRLELVSSSIELLDMVAYKLDHLPSTRHLRGNWLAYWRHETTRSEKDNQALNLKQIRLQSFVGHTNSVRALYALENENSFISASKDKTVKLWSLRSEGDGRKSSTCQFTYTAHKKSINSLSFLESLRYVVSCDSGVHLWDPFIGRPLGILDAPRHSGVTVVKCLPSHSPLVVAGTAESTVRIIDARSMQYVNEWRVCPTALPNATVRCLAVAPSGNWLAAGLSSGGIVQLDTRTGIILNSWRPMECDLLQLSAPSDQLLISSALDHSLAVWHALDGILHYQLKPPPEPAHFLQSVGSSLIYATTGNRVGVYSDVGNSHAQNTITKLRPETFRGVLTSLAVLPLNRAFLAGNESGNIALLC